MCAKAGKLRQCINGHVSVLIFTLLTLCADAAPAFRLQTRLSGSSPRVREARVPIAKFVQLFEDSSNDSYAQTHDFAAYGDAVAAVAELLDIQTTAEQHADSAFAERVRQLLNSALQHLFPFLSPDHRHVIVHPPQQQQRSRGLVIPLGNADFQCAAHLIATVRNVLKSTLPIEVMYAGHDDLQLDRQKALESLGDNIVAIDILDQYTEDIVGLQGGGWAIKPFAILASSFQEVIIADADAVFLQPAEAAFSQPEYLETGTLFFHDRIVKGGSDGHDWWHRVMAGRDVSTVHKESSWWNKLSTHEMESGVVAINKGKRPALLGLLFVTWMNTRHVRDAVTYKMSHGDKESFWMAFELAGIPYLFCGDYASGIGHVHIDPQGAPELCPMHLLHLDHDGKPFWWNGSLYAHKKEQKKSRTWLQPSSWAASTGTYDLVCMRDFQTKNAVHETSEDGYDKLYNDFKAEAIRVNSVFDDLII